MCDDECDTLTQSTLRNTIGDTLRDVDDDICHDEVDNSKPTKPQEYVSAICVYILKFIIYRLHAYNIDYMNIIIYKKYHHL